MHLYLHVPFCARRCSYCDFAIAVRRVVPDEAYVRAVLGEWAWHVRSGRWDDTRTLATVYFGGGTPSRLAPRTIGRLLEAVDRDRPLAPGAEVTLEANPEDVTSARAREWQAVGVTRVSLGVQSFDDRVLAWMHRVHGGGQAAVAVAALRAVGLDHVSLDLIYGVPEILQRDWPRDLDAALALEPVHVSLYGLTAEPRTPLGRWIGRGQAVPAAEGRVADEFLEADRRLAEAGFLHYEVSNFSLPGHQSRHNLAYWSRASYLGMGPSAHSSQASERWWNVRDWEAYRRRLESGGSPEEGREVLGPPQVGLEERYLGLRTLVGVPASSLPGEDVSAWMTAGWARRDGSRVVLTAEGWLRLDALVARLA